MKLNVLKLSLLGVVTLFTINAKAQVKVGIHPTSINSSAVLEVESTNKGFLPPRVALTSTASPAPLAAHVQGMIVYNTATVNDVAPALYVNDGTKWIKAVASTIASNTNSNIVTLEVGQTASYYSGAIASSAWANGVILSSLTPSNPTISFEGLRIDVGKSDNTYWMPRIYNTSATNSITFSYNSRANVNHWEAGTKKTLAAGTSNFENVDGDNIVYWGNNDNQETEIMDIVVNERWYRVTWLGYQIDNNHYIRILLTRLQ